MSTAWKPPRVYPILDSAALGARGCSLSIAAAALIQAGASILQIRHKAHWSRAAFEETRHIAQLCREAQVTLIINDRADIARLLRAGVHVGQDDLPPRDARALIGPGAVLGFSTHNLRQLEQACGEPVNYLAMGPVFGTASKDNPDPTVGLEQLRPCRALYSGPLVAIGGITRINAQQVFDVGADSVAIISDLLPDPCTSDALRQRMEDWLKLTA